MPNPSVTVVHLTPGQMLTAMIDQARRASTHIMNLATTPLSVDETPGQRAMMVTKHAIALADAFAVIDLLTLSEPNISPAVADENSGVSPLIGN